MIASLGVDLQQRAPRNGSVICSRMDRYKNGCEHIRATRARMAMVLRLDALVHIEDALVRAQFDIEDFFGKLNDVRSL